MQRLTTAEQETLIQWCRKYGSGNCWTGTNGYIASLVWRLIHA